MIHTGRILKFTKMHGLGNDFLVTDSLTQDVVLTPELIRQLSNRHLGIGFDQLLLVEPPENPTNDFRYRIFNADGSEVEQCGNGARCFAKYISEKQFSHKTNFQVETMKGLITLTIEKHNEVRVNMGVPIFTPESIPFITTAEKIDYSLIINDEIFIFGALSMGNPHAVLQVEKIDSFAVKDIGLLIQNNVCFPQKVNVGFMEIQSPSEIKLRVFERGVGETQACGTGACAAVAYGRMKNLLDEIVRVQLPGGMLTIEWHGKNQPLYMTGPAETVYEGSVTIPYA